MKNHNNQDARQMFIRELKLFSIQIKVDNSDNYNIDRLKIVDPQIKTNLRQMKKNKMKQEFAFAYQILAEKYFGYDDAQRKADDAIRWYLNLNLNNDDFFDYFFSLN